jgi:hypothetical protein
LGRHLASVSAVTTVLGGAIIMIASLMPWSAFDSILFTIYTVSGVGLGYGLLTLLAGIGLIAVGVAALVRPISPSFGWVAVALAAAAIAVPVFARIDLDFRGHQGPLNEHPAGLSLGIYIVEIGGLVALLGALGLNASPRSKPGAQTPAEAQPSAR